jgi:hypothetical protein
MTSLGDFFKAVNEEKKIQRQEVDQIVSTSFDDFFVTPLKEEITPKPKAKLKLKKKRPKPIKEETTLIEKSIGLLAEPTSVKNEDPLTPLNQNFMTVEAFQKHYQLFLSRIQQQLSTLGGGGEVRLEFLDDVNRDSVKQNNKFVFYNATTKKFEGYYSGQRGVKYSTVSVTSSTYTPTELDYYIGVNYTGAVTITLPSNVVEGTCYVVKDELGQASQGTNRYIDIVPSGSDLIDGRTKATIAIDYGSITLIYRNGWRVV